MRLNNPANKSVSVLMKVWIKVESFDSQMADGGASDYDSNNFFVVVVQVQQQKENTIQCKFTVFF